jgi:cephalosporin-C deacetylase
MTLTPHDRQLKLIEVFDAEFPGFMGQPIKGWFMKPRSAEGPLPVIVEYMGYGGGRGFPQDWLQWPAAGYAFFIVDARGQGSSWRPGDTPDRGDYHIGPEYPGFMTRGIQNRETYYFRRLICDAVRAVDAVKTLDAVDGGRIILTGGSQAGGLTLAAAGLREDIAAAMPDVPFLCHFRRAVTLTDDYPYQEIRLYLRQHRGSEEDVYRVLNYFDGVHFAARCEAPALFSCGLMDTVCPPSTVFAAYNRYRGPKDITVYPYNSHEGGESFQFGRKLDFIDGL